MLVPEDWAELPPVWAQGGRWCPLTDPVDVTSGPGLDICVGLPEFVVAGPDVTAAAQVLGERGQHRPDARRARQQDPGASRDECCFTDGLACAQVVRRQRGIGEPKGRSRGWVAEVQRVVQPGVVAIEGTREEVGERQRLPPNQAFELGERRGAIGAEAEDREAVGRIPAPALDACAAAGDRISPEPDMPPARS